MATKKRTVVAVVNCGSSSVKLDVFVLPSEDNPLQLTVERVPSAAAGFASAIAGDVAGLRRADVGREGTRVVIQRTESQREERAVDAGDTAGAVKVALDEMANAGFAAVDAVGHRVVHGGEKFRDSARIDDAVIDAINECVKLAPLHNPANLAGIKAARERLPSVPHVAVFDTAFHQTLPPDAYLYAIPRSLHEERGVRRYGFHGTSHRYVAERAASFFGRPLSTLRLVTLHLGNGCSACAVDAGKSVDTSMGMTPLEGLVMGTRSGDVDPAVVLQLARDDGIDATERMLNGASGLLGLSKKSHDMRDLEKAAKDGDGDADLAIRAFARRAKKYVGAYAAVLGGLDAVVFTGGIGENSVRLRKEICTGLNVLGALLDDRKNERSERGERDIASMDSRVRLLVIPTDEERAIARDAVRVAGLS